MSTNYLMIGQYLKNAENYPAKCFWTKEKNKCGLKSTPSNNWALGLGGLLDHGNLIIQGNMIHLSLRCNLSCFFKLCIGLLKFVQELWCYLVSCTVLTIPDLEDLWENMEWSKFIVIISLTLFVFFIFRMSQYSTAVTIM